MQPKPHSRIGLAGEAAEFVYTFEVFDETNYT